MYPIHRFWSGDVTVRRKVTLHSKTFTAKPFGANSTMERDIHEKYGSDT